MQTGIGRAQMGSIETQNERGPKCLGGAGGSGRIFGEYGSIFGECGMGAGGAAIQFPAFLIHVLHDAGEAGGRNGVFGVEASRGGSPHGGGGGAGDDGGRFRNEPNFRGLRGRRRGTVGGSRGGGSKGGSGSTAAWASGWEREAWSWRRSWSVRRWARWRVSRRRSMRAKVSSARM
jgi:hypothetical protein